MDEVISGLVIIHTHNFQTTILSRFRLKPVENLYVSID